MVLLFAFKNSLVKPFSWNTWSMSFISSFCLWLRRIKQTPNVSSSFRFFLGVGGGADFGADSRRIYVLRSAACRETPQPTQECVGGRVGSVVMEEEEVCRQAKVHPQQADWSSKVERPTRRQTRYLLQFEKHQECWSWSGRVQSGERDEFVLSDRLKFLIFLFPPSVFQSPFYISPFLFFPVQTTPWTRDDPMEAQLGSTCKTVSDSCF